VVYNGAISEMTQIPSSGQQYLVNYNDKTVEFTSGTNAGYNIPTSGTDNIVATYDKSSPIIRYGKDRESISTYGKKAKIIQNKNIDSPKQAQEILISELGLYAEPTKEINLQVEDVFIITPGHTAIVNLPQNNINNETYTILEVNYDFSPKKLLSDNVVSLKLNKKSRDVTDMLKKMIIDIKKLQASDIDETDIFTRFESATETFNFDIKNWKAYTGNIGSSFILGHPDNGRLGVVTGTQPYLGGSIIFEVSRSGGEF
jgi:hypothetical protein